jgi:hypothetical protein
VDHKKGFDNNLVDGGLVDVAVATPSIKFIYEPYMAACRYLASHNILHPSFNIRDSGISTKKQTVKLKDCLIHHSISIHSSLFTYQINYNFFVL